MDVFNHNEYRALIKEWENLQTHAGARSRLAKAAGCSPSWMTRVMSSSVQLTPDQAVAIASFFHLNESETDYFLLLVDFERAATLNLKNRIRKKMEALKRESRKIAASVKAGESVKEESAIRYYSSWIYSALHVACMIKSQTSEQLAVLLRLPLDATVARLMELEKMGLLKRANGKWICDVSSVHLSSDHPASLAGHVSWRSRTIQQLSENYERGLHYSAAHCLSKADVEKIRDILKKAILKCRDVIEPSPSETLGVLCLDWYEM